jgi:hypothetical protein
MHDVIEERAYLFEKMHNLEEIREVALRMKCGKIDLELVKRFKTKEQLVAYLKSRDCPALRHLEAKLYCGK